MHEVTYAEAINEALFEEMERDERVVVLGEDVALIGGNFTVTRGLYERFGEKRVKDTPISEDAIIGAALGAAVTGLRPVAEIMFSSFLGCCWEQIWNQVSKIRYMTAGQVRVPLVIRTVNGIGRSTAAQHLERPEAWFMHMPGVKVAVPATPYDAKGLLKTAIRDDNPVIFMEQALLYFQARENIPDEEYLVPFGQACIRRAGTDVTVFSYSKTLHEVLQCAAELESEGISVEVIDPRTLVPLDVETLVESVRKTGRLVVVTDEYKTAGVNGEIAMLAMEHCFDYLDAPVQRVTTPDVPVPFSPPLEKSIMPSKEAIASAIRRVVE